VLGVLRHTPRLRRRIRELYWRIRRRGYERLRSTVAVDEKTVFFESFVGKLPSCSPWAIFLAMSADERFDDWRFIWSFKEDVVAQAAEMETLLDERTSIVVRGSKEYFKACAKAKYWVVNNRMPEWMYPRPHQIFIQCWHGTPLKRLGHDVLIKMKAALNTAAELSWRYDIDAAKWSYLLSPSSFTSEHLASAFDLKALQTQPHVIEEGYPRNDFIVKTLNSPERDKLIATLKRQLGIPQDRKVLLYAPTWRDSIYRAGTGYGLSEMPDFALMREALNRQWIILLRAHYFVVEQKIADKDTTDTQNGFLIDVTEESDINELYLIADALLTDYSSVLFDYANTQRPTIYYWPDFEEYQKNIRGFYLDPATLPGDKCANTGELIRALYTLDTWHERYGADYQAFRTRFCPQDDGHAAERVIEKAIAKALSTSSQR
jgi:CDP-glycerol glycerophosphotransferase